MLVESQARHGQQRVFESVESLESRSGVGQSRWSVRLTSSIQYAQTPTTDLGVLVHVDIESVVGVLAYDDALARIPELVLRLGFGLDLDLGVLS